MRTLNCGGRGGLLSTRHFIQLPPTTPPLPEAGEGRRKEGRGSPPGLPSLSWLLETDTFLSSWPRVGGGGRPPCWLGSGWRVGGGSWSPLTTVQSRCLNTVTLIRPMRPKRRPLGGEWWRFVEAGLPYLPESGAFGGVRMGCWGAGAHPGHNRDGRACGAASSGALPTSFLL